MSHLVIVGARQHNLQNVCCELPRDRLVVITGPSGSGKSSLAFDTIYAEGQRRYVESLSVDARQFFRQLPQPDVTSIEGLSPAIAIEQRSLSASPRSTLGTSTELSDYLRLLFARASAAHSPSTGKRLHAFTAQEIVDSVLGLGDGTRVTILAPVLRRSEEPLGATLERLRAQGFVRVRLDGKDVELAELSDATPAEAPHDLDVVVDRVVVRAGASTRLSDSVELALSLGNGTLLLDFMTGQPPSVMSTRLVDWETGESLPEPEPNLFSFNSPHGACPACKGLGEYQSIDPERVISEPSRSLRQGAIAALGRRGSVARALLLDSIVKALGIDADVPWQELPETQRQQLLFGREAKRKQGRFDGLIPMLERLARGEENAGELGSEEEGALSADDATSLQTKRVCPSCKGSRLRPEALAFSVDGKSIAELSSYALVDLRAWTQSALTRSPFEPNQRPVAVHLLQAVLQRLDFLIRVGLGTLTVDRNAATLSGGERQRVRLATQLGSALVGVLYVLDEPSMGLHPEDNERLLGAVRNLVERGNSVIVVEHDRDAILQADYVLDMGPAAGIHGGRIVARGTPRELMDDPASITGPFLLGNGEPRSYSRKPKGPHCIGIRRARLHNLAEIDVDVPLGLVTAVTGVSGSGKSSLIIDTLLAVARAELNGARARATDLAQITGLERLDQVQSVDQRPIGRTPRSNPATYTGVFTLLRQLYASLPEAKARGYGPSRFSFNVRGGRCEKCQGEGLLRVSMHFLPDMFVECEACAGSRYNRETLELRFKGLDIARALRSTVDEAAQIFASVPKILQRLEGLSRMGLGYLELGQAATTLSGGEAQRLKLASELWKKDTGSTLYVLDEPTTGLHFTDLELLWTGISQLRDAGNTVIVIEHNMDLVARADWVIDLGPGAGAEGGRVVATGTPEDLCRAPHSRTARHLARALS